MGGLHLQRGADETALQAARAQFERHGFTDFTPVSAPPFTGFHAGPIHGGPATFHADGDDFAAVSGTLVYDGRMGRDALAALLADFRFPFTDWDTLAGQFALMVRKDGRSFLLTDYFAAFPLFHDADYTVFSTSFLATAKALPRLEFDDQGLYEFAFNVFPTGNDTVLKGIARLGPRMQLELGERVTEARVEKPLPDRPVDIPLEERLERFADVLRRKTAPFAAAYGDAMQCPLSGGLDSRLALALLRDAGVSPHVYVYGSPGDTDVEIARTIAKGEGLALEPVEKAKLARITPDDFAEIVERNFHETDALVTDGGLFDNGGNRLARHARQQGGQLAVSGGCGEVLRNFFFLPDQPMRAADLVRVFFARFTRADVSDGFDQDRFLANLEDKALRALDRPGDPGPLPRTLIEQLYPRMRCRAFFGREISLVGRQGGYYMPFFDRELVENAIGIPLSLKNAGVFEAKLLQHIDPGLAAYPSAYGHAFNEPPALSHRMSEFGTRVRPAWIRQRSYAVQRRLLPMGDEHGGLLTPAYLGRVIDLHFPHMSRYFRVPNIADSGLYRRVATLEYLAQHLEDRLV